MRIALYIGSLAGGGAEKVACNLASYLAKRNHEVTILTMDDGDAQYNLASEVKRISLISKSERRGFVHNFILRYKRIRKIFKKANYDVYIVMLPTLIILSLLCSFTSKARIIAAERNMPCCYSKWRQRLLRCLCGRAAGWCFQTREQMEWYPKQVLHKPYCIIPNAINPDIEQIIPEVGIEKVIVSAGRLTNQKNHSLLIDAFAKIASQIPNYKLIIYGAGPLEEFLQVKIRNLQLNSRIVLAGHSSCLVKRISTASLFVLPSNFEGMPNALIEAMGLGLPCIATDCDGGGARFLINNEVNGLLVPKKDVDGLAESMLRLIQNQELATALGKEASKIKSELSAESIYNRWEKFIINTVISQND